MEGRGGQHARRRTGHAEVTAPGGEAGADGVPAERAGNRRRRRRHILLACHPPAPTCVSVSPWSPQSAHSLRCTSGLNRGSQPFPGPQHPCTRARTRCQGCGPNLTSSPTSTQTLCTGASAGERRRRGPDSGCCSGDHKCPRGRLPSAEPGPRELPCGPQDGPAPAPRPQAQSGPIAGRTKWKLPDTTAVSLGGTDRLPATLLSASRWDWGLRPGCRGSRAWHPAVPTRSLLWLSVHGPPRAGGDTRDAHSLPGDRCGHNGPARLSAHIGI